MRDETRTLLIDRPRSLTYERIALDCGTSVRWLQAFAAGKIDNPGVVTVETLNTYLKSEPHSTNV